MAAVSKQRRNLKQFATYFFIALLILCIPFIAAGFNFMKLSKTEISVQEEAYYPKSSDALTLLTAVRREEGDAPAILVLLKFDPSNGKIVISAIPPETMVEDAGRFDAVSAVWKREGAQRAARALETALYLSIDRWLDLEGEGFVSLADTVGAVDYMLESPLILNGMTAIEKGRQVLDGRRILSILFAEGSSYGRLSTINSIAAETARQRIGMMNSSTVEAIFNAAVNSGRSDMTVADLEERRHAVAYMLERPLAVKEIPATGSYNEAKNTFLPSAHFLASIKKEFK